MSYLGSWIGLAVTIGVVMLLASRSDVIDKATAAVVTAFTRLVQLGG